MKASFEKVDVRVPDPCSDGMIARVSVTVEFYCEVGKSQRMDTLLTEAGDNLASAVGSLCIARTNL